MSDVRKPGDPPRREDFVIVPENNGGVPYVYTEVVRGKDARRQLEATACSNCVKVIPFLSASVDTMNSFTKVTDHWQHQV